MDIPTTVLAIPTATYPNNYGYTNYGSNYPYNNYGYANYGSNYPYNYGYGAIAGGAIAASRPWYGSGGYGYDYGSSYYGYNPDYSTSYYPSANGYGGYGYDYGSSYYGYNPGYGYDQGYALGGAYVPSCSYVGGPKGANWRCR